MLKRDKLTMHPTFSASFCQGANDEHEDLAEMTYANFQRLGHSSVLTGFLDDILSAFEVSLLTNGKTLRCILRAIRPQQTQAENNLSLPYEANLDSIAHTKIDALFITAAKLEENRLSETPVRINMLPSTSSRVVDALNSLSRAGALGIKVEYRYAAKTIELPQLPREAFANLAQPESPTRTVNTIITGVDRDWNTLEVGLMLADGSRLQTPQGFDIDTACRCIITKTLLVGQADYIDGKWCLAQGWRLTAQREFESI